MKPGSPLDRAKDLAAVGGVVAGASLGVRALRSPPVRFARMAGSSIAAPDAAPWITDFLNAAYYVRPEEARSVADLRLAAGLITTAWHRGGARRLRATDAWRFHRAFGRQRFLGSGGSPRGTLTREQLLAGSARLHGDWFASAWHDDARRGWGIAFRSPEEKLAHDPEVRLRAARLAALSPPAAPGKEQIWHTYPPVPVASADAVVAALSATETWPDYASEVGRFTPLRATGLEGQTFEIEVVAFPLARAPLFTRGYVTITKLVSTEDDAALSAYVADLNDGLARLGRDEPAALPDGATPLLAFDLTTHEGHFMGRSLNRLLLFEQDGQAYLRAAGTWDAMPWHLDQAYRRAGHEAQGAFWGMGSPAQSMLHQIALAVEVPD